MSWSTYEGLALPECAQCCQCQIICVSHEFDGSPGCEEVALVANSGTDPTTCATRSIDVTVAVEGNVVTSTGEIVNGGASDTGVAGFRDFATNLACGSYQNGPATGTIDMNGTGSFKWGVNLVFVALRSWLFGETLTQIDAIASIGACQKNVFADVIGFSDDPPVTGDKCVAFFDCDRTSLTDCGGAFSALFLTDGTVHVRYVRAKLRLSGLTLGGVYVAALIIYERAIGSSDPWVFSSQYDYEFEATDSVEYTAFAQVGGTDNTKEYSARACFLRVAGEGGGTYDECYDAAVAAAFHPEDFPDDYDDGYLDGQACSFLAFDPPTWEPAYNPSGGTCAEGTAAGEFDGEFQSRFSAYDNGFNDAVEEFCEE